MAPAMIHAAPAVVSITVIPDPGEIHALGQSEHYTATAKYADDTTEDITGTATWGINDPSIASNDGGGAFKATAEGGTYVTATFGGVTGGASLNVWRPGMSLDVGLPDETTGFNLWASGCKGLAWDLDVTGPTPYHVSGTIGSDEWYYSGSSVLSEGQYYPTFTVGGAVQDWQPFRVWDHTASIDVNPGLPGGETKITLNANDANDGDVYFEIDKYVAEGDYWDVIDKQKTKIDSDSWSYPITYTLAEGSYWAGFSINNRWEGSKDFSVGYPVAHKPPVKKADPATGGTSGPAINEKPITSYDKTSSGFVNLFYNRILSRASEKAGLDAWVGRLTSEGLTGSDLVSQFIFGQECQKIISGYTNTAFVTFLYKTLFNREPDKDGLNAWLARINGGMTKEEVVNGFTHSLEFELICKNFGIKPYPNYTETGK